jgi:hypothetical protein
MKIPICGKYFVGKKFTKVLAAGLVVALFPMVRVGAQSAEQWSFPTFHGHFLCGIKFSP